MLNRIKSKRLTMTELFSIAANIYKKNMKTILFVSFFIIIPLFYINEWLTSRAVINLDYLYNDMIDMDMTAEINAMTSASLYKMVSSIVQMVLQPLVNIAIIWGAVNIIKEQTNNAKDNFLYSFSKAPSAVWTTFLQVVFLFVIIFSFLIIMLSAISEPSILSKIFLLFTAIVCVVIVAYFTTIWIFADCVVAIQNMSGLRALIASKKAVQYRFLGTFLCMLLFGGISNVINIAVVFGLNNIYNDTTISNSIYIFLSMICSFIYHVVINGFYIVFLVVLFLNIIWANQQNNGIYYTEVKTDNISQSTKIEQEEKEDSTQQQLKTDNFETSLIQEQKNNINLDKTTETEQQNQNDEQNK